MELLHTLRCPFAIRYEWLASAIHYRLDNLGVVKKYRDLGSGLVKATTAADTDLCRRDLNATI